MWTYQQVKQTFIEYFVEKNHIHIPSSSLVPTNDTTLLFTNSGMVQFKNIFLDTSGQSSLRLVCNSQKCIRAGGKHNDLDDVGKDSYHHTFFEMLGSWSFNYNNKQDDICYFKEKAIDMAWDLLINIYKLDPDRLYVTYFGGNKENNLEEDTETKFLWQKYLPKNKILSFDMKENFWEMGYTGPCGPCTEIHYDRIGNRDASFLVNRDDPSVIEIWNLVFMQYFRNNDGRLDKLVNKHVDTGMGLERLVSVLQNCTNYQIDLFKDIITIIQKETNGPVYEDRYGDDDPEFINMAYRVIADHLRTMIFAIGDGVVPEATERGYILRRIIRRATRFIWKLNREPNILTKIIEKTVNYLVRYYDDLESKQTHIIKVVSNEEIRFSGVMIKGLRYFNKLVLKPNIAMIDLFTLYTSYGFPIDIIRQLCLEKKIIFNEKEYDDIMTEHIKKSKMGKQFK